MGSREKKEYLGRIGVLLKEVDLIQGETTLIISAGKTVIKEEPGNHDILTALDHLKGNVLGAARNRIDKGRWTSARD